MKRYAVLIISMIVLFLTLARDNTAHALTTYLRVAFICDQAPYHFIDENGEAVGMHIDMLNYIAEKSGFEIEFYPMDTGTDCLKALQQGNVDIVLDIADKFSDDRWVTTSLSEEIICTVQNEQRLAQNRPKTVFQLGTITPTIAGKLNSSCSVAVSSQKEAIEYLLSGDVDILVGIKESVLYHLSNMTENDQFSITNNYMGVVSFALLVPDGDYSLLHAFNREIANLRASDDHQRIREYWSHQVLDKEIIKWFRPLLYALIAAAIVVGLYIVISTSARRALRRQVEKQTIELQVANHEISHHLEQSKAESDMRNRIIQYSHLGMVLFDSNYNIRLINDSATVLSGGKSISDVRKLHIFGDIIQTYDEETIFSKDRFKEEKVQTVTLDICGKEYRYRYSIQQILKSGQVWAILLAVEDITDEEAKKHAIFEEEKSKTLNQVVAGIAHEIKNPLTAIKTFVELLEKEEANPDFMEDFIHYVPAEVDRINRLVEGLIGYAKPAKGVAEMLDLTKLVWETVFFAENVHQYGRIDVKSNIEGSHKINGSRDQIKQILINIIINGMESMCEKMSNSPNIERLSLYISLYKDNGYSVVSVRDEGMGMTQEEIQRCMDPFFTTKRTGTGLGLTLSKQYARENNGQLQIISEVGKYTEIQIKFRGENNEV